MCDVREAKFCWFYSFCNVLVFHLFCLFTCFHILVLFRFNCDNMSVFQGPPPLPFQNWPLIKPRHMNISIYNRLIRTKWWNKCNRNATFQFHLSNFYLYSMRLHGEWIIQMRTAAFYVKTEAIFEHLTTIQAFSKLFECIKKFRLTRRSVHQALSVDLVLSCRREHRPVDTPLSAMYRYP